MTMFAQESGMKNRVREIIQVAALILFLALLANALWLAEILRNSGWDGMSWLWSPQFSAYLAAALAVLAYLLPFITVAGVRGPRLWISGIELFFSTVVAFLIAKNILYGLFSRLPVVNMSPMVLYLMLGALLALIAGSFYLTTQRRLHKPKLSYYFWLLTALAMPVPLSLLTIKLFPGLGEGRDLFDAVKMGYPLFWAVLSTGAAGILGAVNQPKPPEPEYHENILDDVEF